MTERKLNVFLCHASQDKPVARELYHRLTAEGWIDPWLDKERLLPGQDWHLEIEKAVEAADAVIVILSSQSVNKEGYVQRERRFALDLALEKPEGTIFVIPLRLDECEVPRQLKTFEYADYFPLDQRENTYQLLRKSLRERAKSLGLEVNEVIKPAVTAFATMEAKAEGPTSQKAPRVRQEAPQVPVVKLHPAICGVCHKPFGILEQTVTCDSCGARYHKMCGYKLMDLRLVHTCLKCGRPIGAEKFRDSLG